MECEESKQPNYSSEEEDSNMRRPNDAVSSMKSTLAYQLTPQAPV